MESESLIKGLIELVYFMRGSIQYTEMLNRTPGERALMKEFVSTRLEVEQKKMYPVY